MGLVLPVHRINFHAQKQPAPFGCTCTSPICSGQTIGEEIVSSKTEKPAGVIAPAGFSVVQYSILTGLYHLSLRMALIPAGVQISGNGNKLSTRRTLFTNRGR